MPLKVGLPIKNVSPSTRERIMSAALSVFSQKRFHNATINEIAQGAGVAEATIYEYFKSKEQLLFEIASAIMEDVFSEIDLHLQGIEGAFNKLRKLIWFYLGFLENNMEWASIVLLNLRQNPEFWQTKVYEKLREYSRSIIRITEEGKLDGTIRKDVDANLVRDLIAGFVEHVAVRWLLMKKPESLIPLTNSITELVVRAVANFPEGRP